MNDVGASESPKGGSNSGGKRSLAPVAKARSRGKRRVPSIPPWGRATSPAKRRMAKPFREVLDSSALAGTEKSRFGNAFGPQPKKVNGCRSLLGIEPGWVGSIVTHTGEGFELKKGFDEKLDAMRKECKTDERYARALITLGDKVLTAGKAPVIANVVLGEVVKELFTLNQLDTRCVAAFICRVQLNSSYISTEKPIIERIIEGEWRIRSTPAFIALAKRLMDDLVSKDADKAKWAGECCMSLGIEKNDLLEIVSVVEGVHAGNETT